MTGLLTPSQVIDELGRAYYSRLTEGVNVPCWAALPDFRKERHRRAVRSLLLRHMELSEQRTPMNEGAPISWVRDADAERVTLRERIKQRAG